MVFVNLLNPNSFWACKEPRFFFSIKGNVKKKISFPRNLFPIVEKSSLVNSFLPAKRFFKQERFFEKIVYSIVCQFPSTYTEEDVSFKKEKRRYEKQFRNRNTWVRTLFTFFPPTDFFFFKFLLELFFLLRFFSQSLKKLDQLADSLDFLLVFFVEALRMVRPPSSLRIQKKRRTILLKIGAHPVFFYENFLKNRYGISKKYH